MPSLQKWASLNTFQSAYNDFIPLNVLLGYCEEASSFSCSSFFFFLIFFFRICLGFWRSSMDAEQKFI